MPRFAAALAVFLTAVTCIGFNTARYPAVWDMVASNAGRAKTQQPEEPAEAAQSVAVSQSTASPQSAPARDSQVRAEPAAEASGERRGVTDESRGVSEESSPAWTEGGPIMTPDCEHAGTSVAHSHVTPNGQSMRPSAREAPLTSRADVPECPAREELFQESPDANAFSRQAECVGGPSGGEQRRRDFRALNAASPVEQAEDRPGREADAQTGGSDQSDRQTALVPVAPPDSSRHAAATRSVDPGDDSSPVARAGDAGRARRVRRLPAVDQVADNKPPSGPTPVAPRPGDPIPVYPTTGIQ